MSGITERTKVITGEGPLRAPADLVRDGALFAWACRTGEVRDGELASVCEISGTDPGEYQAHMHGHGRQAPVPAGRPARWKPPGRREYKPKAMDPGQRVTWHVRIDGHHAVPPHFEGGEYRGGTGWAAAVEYSRSGTVWSVATSATAWWVVPDDEPGNAVVIRRAGKSYRHHWPEGTLYQSREYEGWRDAMRRAENARRRGVFAVIERTDPGRRNGPDTHTLRWHADQACPDAAGRQRWDGQGSAYNSHGPDGARWSAHSIATVLAGVTEYGGSLPVCARCVLLEEPAAEPAAA